MRKKSNCLIMVVIGLLLLSGCREKTVQLGLVGTLSGQGSDLAVNGRRGAETAIREINETGGINGKELVLVTKDDANDPDRASTLVNEFIDENINVVIGHYTSGMMMAAINQVNNNEILYLAPTVSADVLGGIDDNMIRFIATTEKQADAINKLASNMGHKDFLLIVDAKNSGFVKSLCDNFAKGLESEGGRVISQYEFDLIDEYSLNRINELIEDNGYDAIFIIANSFDFAAIAQELFKQAIDISLYGPLWARTGDLIQYGGESVEGAYFVSAIDRTCECPKFNEVQEKYQAYYGETMSFSAMYTYEAVYAYKMAYEMSEKKAYQDIKKALISIGTFEGLQNEFSIDASGDNVREYIMEQIIDGEYERVD